MAARWYAIRPGDERNMAIARIEKADTPEEACRLAFGRGLFYRWAYKDLGPHAIRSVALRQAVLRDANGWIEVKRWRER